jgi:hypothetical protein
MHPLAKNWYTSFTELVHADYRSGTLSLPKTGTLLVTDYKGASNTYFYILVGSSEGISGLQTAAAH